MFVKIHRPKQPTTLINLTNCVSVTIIPHEYPRADARIELNVECAGADHIYDRNYIVCKLTECVNTRDDVEIERMTNKLTQYITSILTEHIKKNSPVVEIDAKALVASANLR